MGEISQPVMRRKYKTNKTSLSVQNKRSERWEKVEGKKRSMNEKDGLRRKEKYNFEV